ncbi:MAG: JDVT-CTERM system glutamic-type intramembrane protease [Pseudomonadota bacterium]|nr:JDVT-CTERM system glutamic-type intramembrane protease [Pseudomonadota bacterium]
MNNNNKLLWGSVLLAPLLVLCAWLAAGLPMELQYHPKTRTILLIILLIPLCEEIVFRGLLQNELASYGRLRRTLLGLSWDNLISSTLFTLVHVFYFESALLLAIEAPALLFGYFYSQYRRLIFPVLLHIWYNAHALLVYCLVSH